MSAIIYGGAEVWTELQRGLSCCRGKTVGKFYLLPYSKGKRPMEGVFHGEMDFWCLHCQVLFIILFRTATAVIFQPSTFDLLEPKSIKCLFYNPFAFTLTSLLINILQ